MVRSVGVKLFVIVVTLAGALMAQSKPSAPAAPAADANFAPIAWLVGGTWVSEITDLANDTATHVENRVRWAPNGKAIQFVVNFDGVPHYNGFYAYNPASKNIGFYYTSSEGELTIGTATPDQDGKTVHDEFDVTHADGTTEHLRSTLVRDGDSAYWLTVFMQKNGQWAQVFRIRYERKTSDPSAGK